jgi:tRNA uridine 5-carboxymethylaminomethyl modification enzyme
MFQEEYDVIVVVLDMLVLKPRQLPNLGSKPFGYNEPTEHCANVLQSCHGRNCKGQIVREIDALGGYSGIVSDRTAIQFKMLNKSGCKNVVAKSSKRPYAVAEEWRLMLEGTPNLDFTKRW